MEDQDPIVSFFRYVQSSLFGCEPLGTGCFNPSVNFDTILISHIHGAIPKPFNVVIVHMVRFNIMYDNPWKHIIYPSSSANEV